MPARLRQSCVGIYRRLPSRFFVLRAAANMAILRWNETVTLRRWIFIMSLRNSPAGYGALTKLFHWLIALLILLQYISANIMLRTSTEAKTLGLGQGTYYNWHKSLGLVVLLVMLARLTNRWVGKLPPWAPTLTTLEQIIVHRTEQVLYGTLLIVPLSGFVYVMAGNYGVLLFGLWDLPNPIGTAPLMAKVALWVHVGFATLLLLPLGTHLGLVLGHQFGLRDRLIHRMLPGRTTRQ
jgi:cytochrome b561